ncbi:MAG: hypothetical protein NZ839_01970, partial [Endomicrobia bacterium]|nr:hypothetical protein [Endomicrobiia bacterium]
MIKINDDIVFTTDVRKLYFMIKYNILDLYFGRQLLKFGEGYIFNPLNLLSKINFKDVNFTRDGVDIIRLRIQLSDKEYLDNIFLPRKDLISSDYVLRFTSLLLGLDTSLVGYYLGKPKWLSFGFSFKGDLVLGLYSEILYTSTQDTNKRFYSFVFGTDYSLQKKILMRIEYIYNSSHIDNFLYREILYLPNYPFIDQQYLATKVDFLLDLVNHITLLCINSLNNKFNFFIFSYKKKLFQ